ELANEALPERSEPRRGRLGEVQIGREQLPDAQARADQERALDPREPPQEPRRQAARDPVREQEVQIFLLKDPRDHLTYHPGGVLARSEDRQMEGPTQSPARSARETSRRLRESSREPSPKCGAGRTPDSRHAADALNRPAERFPPRRSAGTTA